MADKPSKQDGTTRPVHVRLPFDVLACIDEQAYRQQRSRAFVIAQAVRCWRAFLEQYNRERLK